MANSIGRPTKYTPEIVTKAQHYLDNYEEYDGAIPSVVGLAIALDVSKKTLYNWAKEEDKEDFLHILECVVQKQEQILLRGGLNNTLNATIVKLVLGKHGYHDRAQDTGTQVNVIINRGGVVLESGGETLAIEDS